MAKCISTASAVISTSIGITSISAPGRTARRRFHGLRDSARLGACVTSVTTQAGSKRRKLVSVPLPAHGMRNDPRRARNIDSIANRRTIRSSYSETAAFTTDTLYIDLQHPGLYALAGHVVTQDA